MSVFPGDRGITAALGWIGRWCARFARTTEGVTSFEMGLLKARLRLEPGEEIRLSRVLLLFWEKEWRRGGNLFRRHPVAHCLPRGADSHEVRDLDGGPAMQADGATLMGKGLHVIIDQRPSSVVRIYHRM